ncbi:hypothetical protein ASALC70_02201 [Alcanivorax sp. ALC70]|nr:hypothetical protein ASALC70_02201 [Alcanivorax sp. ALC70]
MPPRNSLVIGSWAMMPYRIMMMDGGSSAPTVPAMATVLVASPGL